MFVYIYGLREAKNIMVFYYLLFDICLDYHKFVLSLALFHSLQNNGYTNSLPQIFPGQRYPVFNFNVSPYELQYAMNRQQSFQYVNGLQIPTNYNPSMWTNAAVTPQTLPRFALGQNTMSNGFQFPRNSFGLQPQTQINQSPGQNNGALLSTPLQTFSDNRNNNWMGRQIDPESTPLVQQSHPRFSIRQPSEQMPDHQKASVQTPVFYRHIPGTSNVNQRTFLPLDVPMARYFWQSNPNVPQPPQSNVGPYNQYNALFGSSIGRTQTDIPSNVNNPESPRRLNPAFTTSSMPPTISRTRNIFIPNYNYASQYSGYRSNIPGPQKSGILNRGVNYPTNVPVAPQPGQVGQGLYFPSNVPVAPQPGQVGQGLYFPSNVPMAPQPGQVGQSLHFQSNVPLAPQQGQVGQGLHFPSNVPVAPQPGQVGQGLHFPSNVPVAPQPGQVGQGLHYPSNVPVAPQPGQVGQGLHFPSNVPVAPQPGQVNPSLHFPSNVPVAPQPIIPPTRTTPSPPVPTRQFSSCPALNDPGEFLLNIYL